MTVEAQLEAYFRDQVRRIGGMTVKLAPTHVGVPDRLVLLPGGRMYLVELKTLEGKVRPAQAEWHRRAALLGITVFVLIGKEEIDKWIGS